MFFTGKNINEVGLSFLSWVKDIKGDSIDLSELDNRDTKHISHTQWTELLNSNVDESGKVNYKGFITEEGKFDVYLSLLSKNPPGSSWTENEKLAYWINAYNAFTVKLVIDNYPLKSIKDIGGAVTMLNSSWDIKFFQIGGVDFDLNTIEHEIIRKQFDEPRIHFAINCASISCPKLRNEAYVAEKLDEQLEEQAIGFLHNPLKNKISEKESKVSPLFNWFLGDFTKNGTLSDFIQKYHSKFNEENDIEYLDYDWFLNE